MNLKFRTMVLLSGGLDSTVMAYSRECDLFLSFYYGSKHNGQEIKHAKKTATRLGVEHRVIDLSDIFQNFNSALIDRKRPIPHGHYEDKTMRETVVPFRNGILLAIATGVAESEGIKNIGIAAHAGDHAVYPDCRSAFLTGFHHAANSGTYGKVNICFPFLGTTKTDIVLKGEALNIPFEDSYSCYEGDEVQCGLCSTCFERREAFWLASVVDPTEYKDKTPIRELIEKYRHGFRDIVKRKTDAN